MIENYVRAGNPAVVINTAEEGRALVEIRRIAEVLKMKVATWSLTQGINLDGKSTPIDDPAAALHAATKFPENTLYALLDLHPFIQAPAVWRTAKDVFASQKSRGIVFLFINVGMRVIPELEREMVVTSLPLPTRADLEAILRHMAGASKFPVPADPAPVVEAALGLTANEAENALALSLVTHAGFEARVVSREKEQIVKKSGVLEIISPEENMEQVGGLSALKAFLRSRVQAYSPEAAAYGLPAPRGVLLVGVPGCGKSLSAKALAAEWQKPLLRLDAGRLFGSYVGESEGNTRRALEVAEAVAPAVLWIDEVEKGLAGAQSSGKTDGGVTARVFGQFLTWMQEKKAPVFVVATANGVDQLPPEFLRKGRFDEIFFVDLPNPDERQDIFRVQLKKRKRDPADFVLDGLVRESESMTGAEIEEGVVSAMFAAYEDGRRAVATADIARALKQITPLAVGMAQKVEALRAWARDTARLANGTAPKEDKGGRVIRRE